ncbi:MAG TPA: carboxypeptidase regulatory-like domain-containing protein [Vicinamibacterales bacterium]|jgi:hypothetical protein
MKFGRSLLLAFAIALCVAASSLAQQPGEIFGKVSDAQGGVMPGVTVTLTGPSLLQPVAATSSATGTYRFPGLGVGAYAVRFELTGFKTLVRDAVRVEIGANVQVNASLEISQVQETVTVQAETPVVDLRDTGKSSRFTQEALQSIPSARDPWVMIEQTPSVAMDRQNVGGSGSGQQSNFMARGAAFSQQKWNLDGVDITDMAATGGSPVYFDFDTFEEMQVSTGGSDVTMQSPGVAVNVVTKSGTDALRGSTRFYITDQKFQSNNVTDEIRRQGASSGNPIQNIKDYGFEVGGPIRKGRAWFWGSYGKQDIRVGINNFFLRTDACRPVAAAPLNYPVDDVRACLNTDQTILNNYNFKVAVELFKNNQFSWFYNGAEKVRNARGADDLHPIESTNRQIGVADTSLGSSLWKTGMPKTYKWSDRQIFSDKLMMEYQYAHVGNNFVMDFHEDALSSVQVAYDRSSRAFMRSFSQNTYVRPTDSVDVTLSYFLPGKLGGDHAIKAGFKYRNDLAFTRTHWGGNTQAWFDNFTTMNASAAQLYRDGTSEGGLHNRSFYVQDAYSRKRLTVNLGFRFDYQSDFQQPKDVPANPFYGQATFKGVYNNMTYTGQPFNQLPALSFPGADSGVAFKTFSPRIGLTYDLTGDSKNVFKFNFARYVGQLGTGALSGLYLTTGSTLIRYPWVDLNNDKFVQANEVVLTAIPQNYTPGYDYTNPTRVSTTGSVDPSLKPDATNEVIIGFDRQLGPNFGVSASYIYRKYSNFRWTDGLQDPILINSNLPNAGGDTVGFTAANYVPVTYTPPASACPAGAYCPAVTYYQPTSRIPTTYVLNNQPGYERAYQGFELSLRKRMSKRWMMSGGFSYNDATRSYASDASYEDPTNIDKLDGGQFAPLSSSSGLGNVFPNAKWIFRLTGAYQLPLWQVGVAGFYNVRQGYPFIRTINIADRLNGAGQVYVMLDKVGDVRLPTFQQLDVRVDKPFTLFKRLKVQASVDIFNLFNANTSLSIRGTQNAGNANQISSLLAPRVIRFGFRATF